MAFSGLQRYDVVCLRAFLTRGLGEFDPLAVFEGAVAFTGDGAVVDKEIFAILALDKTKTFRTVEPFDGSSLSF
jgi:hypothetical protein